MEQDLILLLLKYVLCYSTCVHGSSQPSNIQASQSFPPVHTETQPTGLGHTPTMLNIHHACKHEAICMHLTNQQEKEANLEIYGYHDEMARTLEKEVSVSGPASLMAFSLLCFKTHFSSNN